jgi:chromosome segregation ATPase
MSEEQTAEGGNTDGPGFDEAWDALAAEAAGPAETPPADEAKDALKEPKEPRNEAPVDEPPASAETTDDLWKDAPPALREAYERERTRADTAETTVKRHSGRLSQANQELKALRETLESQRAPAASEAADGESEEDQLKRLREEYPDVAQPLLNKLAKLEQAVSEISGVEAQRVEAQTEEYLAEQKVILAQEHPQWNRDCADQRFAEWANGQLPYIQEVIRRNGSEIVNGSEVADVLTRYKRDMGIDGAAAERHREKREDQREALTDTRFKAPPAAKAGADDYDAEWDRLAREDARKRAGAK